MASDARTGRLPRLGRDRSGDQKSANGSSSSRSSAGGPRDALLDVELQVLVRGRPVPDRRSGERLEHRPAARGALHRVGLERQAIAAPPDPAEDGRLAVAVGAGPRPGLAVGLELGAGVEAECERLAVGDVEPHGRRDQILAIGGLDVGHLGVEERAGPHLVKERRRRLVERVDRGAAMLVQEPRTISTELRRDRVLHQVRDVQRPGLDLGAARGAAWHDTHGEVLVPADRARSLSLVDGDLPALDHVPQGQRHAWHGVDHLVHPHRRSPEGRQERAFAIADLGLRQELVDDRRITVAVAVEREPQLLHRQGLRGELRRELAGVVEEAPPEVFVRVVSLVPGGLGAPLLDLRERVDAILGRLPLAGARVAAASSPCSSGCCHGEVARCNPPPREILDRVGQIAIRVGEYRHRAWTSTSRSSRKPSSSP